MIKYHVSPVCCRSNNTVFIIHFSFHKYLILTLILLIIEVVKFGSSLLNAPFQVKKLPVYVK